MPDHPLPYGVRDLDPDVVRHPSDPDRLRCFVRGCQHFLRRPKRGIAGEACPDHGIYCHVSNTYSYQDVRRNIIASPNLFAERIVGHPFKFESDRLNLERSEDALSWNVFRSLQEAGCLAQAAKFLVGEDHPDEPDLYLWGICVTNDAFEPWDLLVAARERFENNLPVERPLTEPDIALHLPGKYLMLIEAKFTSPNTFYERGPRKDKQSLTLDELLEIYQDESLTILDFRAAQSRSRIAYQLWRNMVFAEWMSMRDNSATKAYHVSLVRSGYERDSAEEFAQLLVDSHRERFCRRTWEGLVGSVDYGRDPSQTLGPYMEHKTERLQKAFKFSL
jgi:hypothetical protein